MKTEQVINEAIILLYNIYNKIYKIYIYNKIMNYLIIYRTIQKSSRFISLVDAQRTLFIKSMENLVFFIKSKPENTGYLLS